MVDIKERLKQNEAIIIQAHKERYIIIFNEKDCGETVKQSLHRMTSCKYKVVQI